MPKQTKPSSRILPLVVIGLALMVAIAAVALWPQIERASSQVAESGTPAVGGPFTLVDQTGAVVTDQTWNGAWRLIYFGYTFCPDACPTELQVIAEAIDDLGADGEHVQPIFITIDPARDTPERLATFVKAFHPRLVGLTGSPAQIATVAKAYHVYYAKADETPDYAMNHSSFVYLMSPEGRFVTLYSSDMDSQKLADDIRRLMHG